MAMQTGPQEEVEISQINITPFVDVILVLLIIFMISTPALVSRALKVQLPPAKNVQDVSHITLKIVLTRDGTFVIDRKTLDLNGVRDLVAKAQAAEPQTDAVISADAQTAYGKVLELADSLKSFGIKSVGFAASDKLPREKSIQ